METLEFSLAEGAPRGSYDEGADVLYISLGAPRPAVGVEIENGVIVRYDEETNEIVGVTLVGLREKTSRELSLPIPEAFPRNGRDNEVVKSLLP